MLKNPLRVLWPSLVFALAPVSASPIINAVYDSSYTAAQIAQVEAALDFYRNSITNTFTITIAFGTQAGGGATSNWFSTTKTYNAYYNALVSHSSGNATDTSAIASLGGGAHTNNPVTGTTSIQLALPLSLVLGLSGSLSTSTFGGACGSAGSANACITVGTSVLTGGSGGGPAAALFGIIQHEVDEVLGTASALPNGGTGGVPTNPLAADLYRYGASGVRSFALNTSTANPCAGSPTAYFSIDGGVTNLSNYNNCNNGGDYGDWITTPGNPQVQDAFGSNAVATSLTTISPEVTLLDAMGYNINTVPEPGSTLVVLSGLALAGWRKRRARG